MGEPSALLLRLVGTGAELALLLVAARVAIAVVLALTARLLRAGPAAATARLAAVRVSPGFARRTVTAMAGAGLVVGLSAGAAQAAGPQPRTPVLDRVVTAVLVGGPIEWRDPAPSPAAASPTTQSHRSRTRPGVHVVRSGESLWSIAAASSGDREDARAAARLWPRWYARNRALIGPDPAHLVPGQRLHAPRHP